MDVHLRNIVNNYWISLLEDFVIEDIQICQNQIQKIIKRFFMNNLKAVDISNRDSKTYSLCSMAVCYGKSSICGSAGSHDPPWFKFESFKAPIDSVQFSLIIETLSIAHPGTWNRIQTG